ncbi:MAG: hypothetical protein WA771_03600 [Chthoniobacterales bacterium]
MKRIFCAVLLAILATALTWAEVTARLGEVSVAYRGWLGLPTFNGVTFVEFDPVEKDSIPSLDAALLIRAVEVFAPRAVVFASPVSNDGNQALLDSKLSGVEFPVLFDESGEALPESIKPPSGPLEHVDFGDLMVDKMRGEQGMLSPVLDSRFRDRVVVGKLRPASGKSADQRTPTATPKWLLALPILLVASIPFWPGDRTDRVIGGAILAGAWLLAALAGASEWDVIIPSAAMIFLPIIAAIRR